MKRSVSAVCLLAAMASAFTSQSFAGVVNLGTLNFSTVIPADPPDIGVNGFSVSNFTGDPGSGGFALPPDFNVFTPLTLLNSVLTVVIGGVSQDIALGDIGPGTFTAPSLEFAGDTLFDSATLTATLSTISLTLDDASVVTTATDQLSVTLSPSASAFLSADIDLAIIVAETVDAQDIPEPASLLLVGAAICALAIRKASYGA